MRARCIHVTPSATQPLRKGVAGGFCKCTVVVVNVIPLANEEDVLPIPCWPHAVVGLLLLVALHLLLTRVGLLRSCLIPLASSLRFIALVVSLGLLLLLFLHLLLTRVGLLRSCLIPLASSLRFIALVVSLGGLLLVVVPLLLILLLLVLLLLLLLLVLLLLLRLFLFLLLEIIVVARVVFLPLPLPMHGGLPLVVFRVEDTLGLHPFTDFLLELLPFFLLELLPFFLLELLSHELHPLTNFLLFLVELLNTLLELLLLAVQLLKAFRVTHYRAPLYVATFIDDVIHDVIIVDDVILVDVTTTTGSVGWVVVIVDVVVTYSHYIAVKNNDFVSARSYLVINLS